MNRFARGFRWRIPAAVIAVSAGIMWSAADVLPDYPAISSVWPISVIERLKGDRTFTHALPPFFTRTSNPETDRRTVRPLLTSVVDHGQGDISVDVLPPLARATKSPTEHSFNLFPLITHRSWTSDDGAAHQFSSVLPLYHRKVDGAEHHTAVFPVYMSGTAGSVSYPIPFKSARPYTAVFPLYGNLYGAFGNDRVTFALWPFYTRIEKKGFVKHQLLWPFLTYGSGGGYRSFKVWPLYGRTEKEGEYVSQFAFWPVFNFTKNLAQDTGHVKDITAGLPVYWDIQEGTRHARSLFPFHGKRTTPDLERSFRMWPLYINTNYVRGGYRTRDYLWPIFSKTDGSQTGYKFWPLFGVRKSTPPPGRGRMGGGVSLAAGVPDESDLSMFYLWTLGKYEKSVRKTGRRTSHRFFPLYIYGRHDDPEGYRQRQFFLWPLISYQEDTLQDVRAVSFLNLLGTIEAQFPQIQEVYSPLWRVIDYARQGDESRLSLLWNLVDVRRDREKLAMSVGPFFSVRRDENGIRSYTLLTAFHIRNRGTVRESPEGPQQTVRQSPRRLPTFDARAFNHQVSAAWRSGVDWVKSFLRL